MSEDMIDTIALLRVVASGHFEATDPTLSPLVEKGYVTIGERKGQKVVRLTVEGLKVLQRARTDEQSGHVTTAESSKILRTPSFGKARCVLYVPAPMKERAAIIVDTHKDGTANLLVFPTDPQDGRLVGHGTPVGFGVFIHEVPYSSDLSKEKTWHWLGEGHKRTLPKGD